MSTAGGTQVAIIGGGPAGSTVALCLARTGIDAVVLERSLRPAERIGESLAPGATPLLQRLGLFDAFLTTDPLPCFGNRSSWGGDGRLTDYDFIRDPNGHGWHIDRRRFDAMLLESARAAGARCLAAAELLGLRPGCRGGWQLEAHGQDGAFELGADVVVDATGRTGAVARRLDVVRRHYDGLLAVSAFLVPAKGPSTDSMTLVEARPEGWWYSASLPNGRLIVSLMTDPDILSETAAWRTERWRSLLEETEHTRARIEAGCYRSVTRPQVSAAGTSTLEQVSGQSWLAAGDAAAAFDPLSSHGIGSAIAGGARAAKAIVAQLGGDSGALERYAEGIEQGFGRFLPLWHAYYREETRWPRAPFWARRHGALRGTPLITAHE